MNIAVETICKPTEDKEKVKNSILNIFPDLRINEKENILMGKCCSLNKFKEKLRNQRIRDSARRLLLRGKKGNKIVFKLNKQVAFVDKICFAEEKHPLGDITVTIEDESIDRVIEEITGRGENEKQTGN